MAVDNITQRKLLVTGASSGIGRAICRQLLRAGYQVVAVARDFSKFSDTHNQLFREVVDLSDLDALPSNLSAINRYHPDLDGFVSCAGRGQFGSLEEFSYDQIQSLVELNFTSHAFITRALLPGMKRRGGGDLIFIGSEAALNAGRKGAIYCASKFALRGFAQALRDECAKGDVRVSVINPGMVKTPFFESLSFAPGDDEMNYVLPDDVAAAVMMVLTARQGTVFDEINLTPLKKVVQFR